MLQLNRQQDDVVSDLSLMHAHALYTLWERDYRSIFMSSRVCSAALTACSNSGTLRIGSANTRINCIQSRMYSNEGPAEQFCQPKLVLLNKKLLLAVWVVKQEH